MSYTTTHNTAARTMTIDMSAGFEVFVDWRNQIIVVLHDGKIKDQRPMAGVSLAEFETIINNTLKTATQYEQTGLHG